MEPNTLPREMVVILGTDVQEAEALSRIIDEGPYRTATCASLAALESSLASDPCLAVILDIDSVPLDNRTIRKLTLSFPSIYFLGTSRDRFHPELKQAICYHLFACLNKPIDPEELHYFLKCIHTEYKEIPDGSG